MRIETDVKFDFKDVLICPKRSTLTSRSEVELERTFKFRYAKGEWSGVPIIAANMDHTGTVKVAQVLSQFGLMTATDKFLAREDWSALVKTAPEVLEHTFISLGTAEAEFEKVQTYIDDFNIRMICMDVANGYTELFVDRIKRMRDRYPDKIIMAGNVVTGEMVEQLILSGADIVKVGIGPGSVCTTRKLTGVGYPQLSAIIECADAAHGLKGLVCGDGGCTVPGDVAKAFAAGSDFVMLGGMLAGHDECSGDVVDIAGKKIKRFYGMGSAEAMEKHRGGVASYRASEGKSVNVPYRGPISETVQQILGGIRSTCTYVGAGHLKELSKRTTFIRVSQQLNEVFTPFNVE